MSIFETWTSHVTTAVCCSILLCHHCIVPQIGYCNEMWMLLSRAELNSTIIGSVFYNVLGGC